jgi:hypothetical protein
MLYELATLGCRLMAVGEASEGVRAWVSDPEAGGVLLGCWRTDIGTLGRLMVLRGFATRDDLAAEHKRTLLSASPFNAGSAVESLSMEGYAPFPFLPPVRPRAFGGVYEFRGYRLKPGGVAPTMAAWEAAIGPAREYTDHLVINMYALDGPVRITHIWGFESLEQRSALRAEAYAAGVWPPKGGPEEIIEATSMIGVPEGYSPLC